MLIFLENRDSCDACERLVNRKMQRLEGALRRKRSRLNIKLLSDDFRRDEKAIPRLEQLGVEVLYGYWYARNIHQWLKQNGRHIDWICFDKPSLRLKYLGSLPTGPDTEVFSDLSELIARLSK